MPEPESGASLGAQPPRRIAVFRALQLGDLLCAVPALRALRAAAPEAEITLIGLPWARDFARRFGAYVDRFLEFPGYPGLPERPPRLDAIPAFLAEAQARRFDLAIQMHGNGTIVNPLVALLGARHVAGYFAPGQYCPDPDRYLPYPDRGLEIRRHLGLVEFLGAPPRGEHLEFPLTEDDFRALDAIEDVRGLGPGDYACVHPGASVAERRWGADRFAAVADDLATRGLRVVLTGTAGERELTRSVARSMNAPAVDLAGRTDLGAVAALLSRSRLLVSNDTGVAHVADALRVPSVILSTGNNPERWSPVDSTLHRVLRTDGGVSAEEVLREALPLLERGAAQPV